MQCVIDYPGFKITCPHTEDNGMEIFISFGSWESNC